MTVKKVKVCTKCGRKKPLDEFHKDKNSKDGHSSRCKECRNAAHREKHAKQRAAFDALVEQVKARMVE